MDSDGTRKTNDGSATKGVAGQKRLDLDEKKPKTPDLDVSLSGQTCDVCYDLLQYPVNLPCSHIFCFLCIKGAYFNNKLCPMCRAPIPDHVIKRPQVKKSTSNSTIANSTSRSDSSRSNSYSTRSKKAENDKPSIFWCYESRRENKTWWKYDARTCTELETFYQQYLTDIDKTFHDLQIAGEMYEIDLSTKRQYRKNHSGKRRLIIRSSELSPADVIVGTAGIKTIK